MQHYVCGFLFAPDRSRVLLIRKRRPEWQAGKLNGVGGKVEAGESLARALRREFREETGVDLPEATWTHGLTLTAPDWTGHFFRGFGALDAARSVTDEQLEIHPTRQLPPDTIPNLHWIIPLLLDDDVIARHAYAVTVYPGPQ